MKMSRPTNYGKFVSKVAEKPPKFKFNKFATYTDFTRHMYRSFW